jgi:hypothetical protein
MIKTMHNSKYDYFYDDSIFYKQNHMPDNMLLPHMLFHDKQYKHLSSETKLLYCAMLHRLFLSQYSFRDEQGRMYIVYPTNDMMEDIACSSKNKMNRFLKELSETGLIIIDGVPPKQLTIYVMDYTS